MAVKLDGKPWMIREQIIEDRLTGLTFQFEVLPDGNARFRVFGSPLPFGDRELLFDADGAEAGDIRVVAAAAFEARLKELEATDQGAKTMDEVITRLKAAEELDSHQDRQAGYRAGEQWARTAARPKQLRRLMKEMEGPTGFDPGEFLNAWGDNIAEGLYGAIQGIETPDCSDVCDFWLRLLGHDSKRIEEWDFACGFIDGATDLWAKEGVSRWRNATPGTR